MIRSPFELATIHITTSGNDTLADVLRQDVHVHRDRADTKPFEGTVAYVIASEAKQSSNRRIEIASSLRSSQ